MRQARETNPHNDLPITHEVRLTLRQWLAALLVVTLIAVALPRVWRHLERFELGADCRIPYPLSNDYWLFDGYLRKTAAAKPIVVLGDSVVWGEYVRADGTLPHFLNAEAAAPGRFLNAGVNGLFPLALEGLVRDYGNALRGRKVIVVCNLLWLTSQKADLQAESDETLNHAPLLPQFHPRVPSYRADAATRLGAVIGRHVSLLGWASHLQNAYFNQRSVTQWTLAEDPDHPRSYPNAARNPLARITCVVPSGHSDDLERGEGSPRHKPWTSEGPRKVAFEWVPLGSSLQWAAFRRTVALLRHRGNDVLVIVAPFNAHLIADPSLDSYTAIQSGIAAWLSDRRVPYIQPDTLPSDLYADASHPLTAGYEALARQIFQAESFQKWIR
jgi:lysophospholipase L1-like esterase